MSLGMRIASAKDRNGTSTSASRASGDDFFSSPTWQGAKPGYYFGTTDGMTGYYRDRSMTDVDGPSRKRRRTVQISEDQNEVRFIAARPTADELLEEAERKQAEDGQAVVVELSARGIRSATSALHRVITQNALQRAEHSGDALQYMDSELALYEHISSLQSVAANALLYEHVLAEPKSGDTGSLVSMLIELLAHDNADVGASVVALFLEWVDPALMSPSEEDDELVNEKRKRFVLEMASRVLNDAWETIVSNISKFQQQQFDETKESEGNEDDPALKGIENVLSLMENLLEIDLLSPDGLVEKRSRRNGKSDEAFTLSAAAYMAKETLIVPWLAQNLDSKTANDEFRGRCLELLAFVAQREDVHQIIPDWSKLKFYSAHVIEDDGDGQNRNGDSYSIDAIESMLQAIGKFRKKQPVSDDQVEYLENACMALSSCISFSTTNLKSFLDGQGIELVVRCLKERVHAGGAALKLLDFGFAPSTVNGPSQGDLVVHRQACEHLVKAGGLKFLFPLWMGTRLPKQVDFAEGTIITKRTKATQKAKRQWIQTIEQQTIRVLYGLTRFLTDDSLDDAKARLVAKFLNGAGRGEGDENIDTSKCDRLVELLLRYDKKSRVAEYNFYRYADDDADDNDPTMQLAALQAKLDGGGDLFHRLGAMAAFLCVSSKRCHGQIISQLQLQQSGIGLVKAAVEEFASVLQPGEQQEQLRRYLDHI